MFGRYERLKTPCDVDKRLMEDDPSVIFAGGTDLMVKGRERNWYEQHTFLDIGQIEALKLLRKEGNWLVIGAGVTLSELISSPAAQSAAPLLCQAAEHVASCQVRNRATLAGNAANACPASDCIPALLVLGAEAAVRSLKGVREVPLLHLYRECKACLKHEGMHVRTCYFPDPSRKKLYLEKGEWIESIRIPIQGPEDRYFFYKLTKNRSSEMAVVNVAINLKWQQETEGYEALTCVGGMFPKPCLLGRGAGIRFGTDNTKEAVRAYAENCRREMESVKGLLTGYDYKQRTAGYLIEAGLNQMLFGIPVEEGEG